ncbi:DEAD/DEAH box helicase [Streptomyces viridochromogenes]|uniref:DEAD/DEAH box helicase n=1 Tax=Streptomyces viridochromogenes TaxID=1938 RepID=UPI00069FAB68|nr:DEAD/DEAH box helicase [Streptomyces viridochromogenes]KOG19709.1 DEAD/DEAH box helicase [Streptomyces viridochromogenes]KOG22358.1 DEAD/DEAH box helicase [Streptomyces viridochromogenes]
MTLPVALSGTDVIGQAKTGTGKTLGFGLPLLERVTVPADVEAGRAKPEALTDAPQALVVVPTRELCTQVTNDLLTAGKVRNVRVLAIYGGRAYEPQVEALKKGVDVVVGTPGRLLDLAGQKKLNLKHIKALVLDEADEMLDLGFLPDVEKIINMLPARRQTMLFSATMPGAVIGLARRYMSQPTHIRATAPDDEGATVANTAQFVYRAHNMDKPEMVARILQADGRGLAMVFCRTKRTAADLADQLQQRGFAAGAVHGDLGQGAREQALRAFRNGKVDVLVCTDVAARGIDVEGVTHVINYQSPEEEKTYLHRIGRTGRAGAKGIAITLVDWDDIPRWQLINKALDLKFNDPPETYSTSPHLFEELNIPAGTKGVLPRSERTRAGLGAEELEDLGETGGRGARGRGGRGGRDESRSSSPDRERSARTPRRRRRTRGGASMDGTSAAAAGPAAADETVEATTAEAVTAPRTPRRRRRTRGGATEPTTAVTATSAAPEPAEAAEAAVATVEGTSLDTSSLNTTEEASAKPRRRRTRKSAEPKATSAEAGTTSEAEATKPSEATKVTEAVQPSEAAAAPRVAESEEAPAAKPRRRTRKATVPAETAVDTAEGTTEAAQETPEAAEAKPRRRTRKATAAAEAAVDTAEATEAKPKTRRTRKTAATAEAAAPAADIPAQTAQTAQEPEAAEAKPKARRTRKTAATAAEAAVDTAEATEAKPKTRRTRKAAAPAETAVDTAEATEAKPRRTRKAAATVAEPEAAEPEAAEAKPRRARKTTAAAEAAVDTAEATEAKPKARRTRKTAAPAEAAAPAADIPAQATKEPVATEEPAPRRRTRKAAATAASVAAADGTAEVKPKVRRTRKTAAAAAATEPVES